MFPTSKRVSALVASAVLVAAPIAVAAPSSAAAPDDPAVISSWNAITTRTIVAENALGPQIGVQYFAYTHLAMYDAVVAIEGGYEPYVEPRGGRTPPGYARGSSEVAAGTAAYYVLSEYFPASAANLDADYEAFLDSFPNGAGKAIGKHVGKRAAREIIKLRRDDGRNANVTYTPGSGPGEWVPTAPAFAAFATPWLGYVKPLLSDAPMTQPPPYALTSVEWAADYNEAKAYGKADPGSARTADQTALALLFSDNPIRQYNVAMRGQVATSGLDIAESARAFAMMNASIADTVISTWRAKFEYRFWRPITAIQLGDTDGNDATVADPTWNSLRPPPPYPDHTSGHASVSGATSGTLDALFDAAEISFTVTSALPGALPSKTYSNTDELDTDTKNARIWLGLHFRKAMTDANDTGHSVAEYATANFFQPTS